MYSPPVKPLRSTEYGSGLLDGGNDKWSGAMSSQASEEAPPDRPCTDVVNSKMADTEYIKLAAYE